MGQLAVCDPVPLADRDPARGVAGRRRLRHGRPPPHRARGGDRRAERLTEKDIDFEAQRLRNVPTQARSRERLRLVLDAADEVLATRGAAGSPPSMA